MDYENIIKTRNHSNAFAKLIGLRITKMSEGYAETELEVTDELKNPINSVHGGVLFTVADVTGGGAAASHGRPATTIDSSFHYLRPGLNTTKLIGKAREMKAGKNILVYDVSVEDQDGVVLAEGIFSFMVLNKPIN